MKKNKKGFTLIELLAVIAILAILVVIAVPAVLDLFNNSKKSAFVTQSQTIYKAAETQIIQDQITPTGTIPPNYCYIREGGSSTSTVSLSGNSGVSYIVTVGTVSGNRVITKIQIDDGTNSMTVGEGTAAVSISDLKDTEIDATRVAIISCPQ